MSKKTKHNASFQQDVSIDDYLAADAELKALRKEHGIEEKEGKLSHLISSFFERRDAREKVLVNKKKHLLLALFLGWCGIFFVTGNWVSLIVAVLVCVVLYLFEIFIDNNFARVKWQVMLKSAWAVALVAGVINTLVLIML